MNYSRPISITQSISKLPKSSVRTKTLWTDILGGSDIHIDIECRDEDHDGLVGDDSHGSRVSSFTSVNVPADGFLRFTYSIL